MFVGDIRNDELKDWQVPGVWSARPTQVEWGQQVVGTLMNTTTVEAMCLRYGYWCICEWVCIRVHQLRKLLNNPRKDTFLLQQGWRVYSIYVLHLLTFATRKALPISTCKRIGKHLKTSRDIGPKPKKHIKTHDWIKIGQECSCPKLFFDNFPLPAHRTVMIHWLCQSIWTIAKCCARPSARASARYPWFRLVSHRGPKVIG